VRPQQHNCAAIDYDRLAPTYAAQRSASPYVLSHIVQAMRGRSVAAMLEAGCGTADYLWLLTRALAARGCGFDRSAGMMQEGRKKNHGLNVQQAEALAAFPYAGAGFDLVFSVNVIHRTPDLHHFFAEAWRVLRPGGIVVTVTDSEQDIQERMMSHYFPGTVAIELVRYHPIATIEGAMHRSGFDTIEISHTRHEFPVDQTRLTGYRNKAFSALRLLPEEEFERGMQQLEDDVRRGGCMGWEVYTYAWGIKV
jgi:SAM-dependent methyltransferase